MGEFMIVDALDQERWDKFVYEHPKGSIFHTSSMVSVFRGAKNHHPFFLAALDKAGDILALLVAVRVQTLPNPLGPVSSRSIFHAEPLCRQDDQGGEALTALLAEHDAEMRNKALFTEVRPLRAAGMEKMALVRRGYECKDYFNFLTDLRRPIDELWGSMNGGCRKNIRRSREKGVRVEEITTEKGVEILYSLLQLGYGRARVPLADKSLFSAAFRVLQPRGMFKMFVAYYNEMPVGADVLLLYKKYVYEWYRGLERIKSIYPGECLVWHHIEWAHQHDYQLYDFGGAGRPEEPYGVRDFKAKFGGELVNYGRYRKIYSPQRLALAEKAYELGRLIRMPLNCRFRMGSQ